MTKVIILIIISELWNAAGQIFYKKGLNIVKPRSLRGLKGYIIFIKDVFSSHYIWLGLGSMVICIAVWLLALAQADLSFVYSMGSIQSIFVLFAAHFLLGEKIDRLKLIGTFLVVGGIVIITLT